MDIESIGYDRVSIYSYSSGRQSYLSLEALTEPRLSLRQKASLIEIMDLQVSRASSRQSDYLLTEYDDGVVGSRLSELSGSNYSFRPNIQEKDLNRKSNYKVKHQCSCLSQEGRCNGVHCSCFLTPQEICVIGQCCPCCISAKNDFFKETRGWKLQSQKGNQVGSDEKLLALIKQKNCKNMHYLKQVFSNDPRIQNLTFCTCKKSQCQKKYCLCYERGVKCNQLCICTQCLNRECQEYEQDPAQEQRRWQRYAIYQKQEQSAVEIEQDIGQFMHEQLQEGQQISQIMEFQPVNFDRLLQNFIQ